MGNFRDKFNHVKQEHPWVSILLLISLLAVGFLTGYLARNVPPLDEEKTYSIFKDIFAVHMAIIALLVGVSGWGMYKFLEQYLQKKLALYFEQRCKFIGAKVLCSLSFTHHRQYNISNNKEDLEIAISLARDAFEKARELDKDELNNLKLTGEIFNNLGYYLAERGDEKDKLSALKYAEYLEKNLIQFPECGGNKWPQTIDFIRKKFYK